MATSFAPLLGPSPSKFDSREVATDGASMVALDTLNRLSLNTDPGAYVGMGVGLALYQMWGKGYIKKNLQALTLATVIADPTKAAKIAEFDAELLVGLKGGLYSVSVYLSSLALKGAADRMNLVDAVLIGYGGSLLGVGVRSSLADKK